MAGTLSSSLLGASAAGPAAGREGGKHKVGRKGVDRPAGRWASEWGQAGQSSCMPRLASQPAGCLASQVSTCTRHRGAPWAPPHATALPPTRKCNRCAPPTQQQAIMPQPQQRASCPSHGDGRTHTLCTISLVNGVPLIVKLVDVCKRSRAEILVGAGHRGDASGLLRCRCWPQAPVLLPCLVNQYVELLQPGICLGEKQAHSTGGPGWWWQRRRLTAA